MFNAQMCWICYEMARYKRSQPEIVTERPYSAINHTSAESLGYHMRLIWVSFDLSNLTNIKQGTISKTLMLN